MKYATVGAALMGAAVAFPTLTPETLEPREDDMPVGMKKMLAAKEKRQGFGINVPFDAKEQYISTSGDYAWVAPGPTDIRGVCPGLNAIANHGYLPHNGVGTIEQFIQSTNHVYQMGLDLAGFLAVYGAVFDGDLTSFSIGGPPPPGLLDLSGLVGQPEGLSGSHNKYEADASPTRPDLFQYGNDYTIIEKQWDALYAMQDGVSEESSNYDLGVLNAYRSRRFNESLTTNPYFFNAPFAGVIVQPAAYTFIFRFMANHSQEFPEGRLSKNVLKSFFGIEGEPGNWKTAYGYERIPDNWYKRAATDAYTIPFFALDVIAAGEANPKFADIGGNLGHTNSFVGLDVQNFTAGVYNGKTLLENNNLMCFGFELLAQALPDVLENIFIDTSAAVNKMMGPIKSATSSLGGCPQLNKIQQSQYDQAFSKYPGFTELKADGTYNPNGPAKPNKLLGLL